MTVNLEVQISTSLEKLTKKFTFLENTCRDNMKHNSELDGGLRDFCEGQIMYLQTTMS